MFKKRYNNFVRTINNQIYLKKINSKFNGTPIIIGGCGRSGTSLLLAILDAHPKIHGIPVETYFFCPTAYTYHPDYWAKFNMKGFYNQWINHINIKTKGVSFCEKSPKNIRYFNRINKLFNGKVKMINIIRDGRDVVLSQHPSKPDTPWVPVERWVRDIKSGLEYIDHSNVYHVKYEDLILNFERTIKDLIKFCELDICNELINWHTHTSIKKHGAWFNGVDKINANSINKWKDNLDSPHLQEFLNNKEAMNLIQKLGY